MPHTQRDPVMTTYEIRNTKARIAYCPIVPFLGSYSESNTTKYSTVEVYYATAILSNGSAYDLPGWTFDIPTLMDKIRADRLAG